MQLYSLTGLIVSSFYILAYGVTYLYAHFCSSWLCKSTLYLFELPTISLMKHLSFGTPPVALTDYNLPYPLTDIIILVIQGVVLYILGYIVQRIFFGDVHISFMQGFMTALGIVLAMVAIIFLYYFTM